MEKLIRDGQVAVLYSPGFGAGWFTWNSTFPECIFDPEIVRMLEKETDRYEIAQFAESKYGEEFYSGGADDLIIMWLPEGTKFIINEYDGSESIQLEKNMDWMVA
jgi:hypothetical protein